MIVNLPGVTYGSSEHAAKITAGRHPGVQTAMAWLCFSHLPIKLQRFCEPLYGAACQLLDSIPADSAELTSAMNRLVETKDWYVRAGIRSDEGKPGPVPRPATVVDPPVKIPAEGDLHDDSYPVLAEIFEDPATPPFAKPPRELRSQRPIHHYDDPEA